MQRFADRYLGKYLRRGYKGGKKSLFPSSQDTSSHATNRTYRVTTTFPTWLNTPARPEQYCQLDRFPISFEPGRDIAHNFSMHIRARKPRTGQWLKYIQLIMLWCLLWQVDPDPGWYFTRDAADPPVRLVQSSVRIVPLYLAQ